MIAIRGAITVKSNTKDEILKSTKVLLQGILESNNIDNVDIISINFSGTKDLTKAYPAVAAREMGLTECALCCFQEMYVEGSLEMCIRVQMYVNSKACQKDAKHVYLEKAKILRPDIS